MAGAIILSLFLIANAAQNPAPPAAGKPAAADAKAASPPVPFGVDEVEPFLPLHPRTAEDRRELEAIRDFVAARALEDRRQPREAIALLEKALKESPDSVPILRRLSGLC